MKNFFLASTLFLWMLSVQAHADYVPQQQSTSALAAQYAHMNVADLQKAAKAGQAAAQFYLATHYQKGTTVAKDAKQAFTWFKAAADQGIAAAQLNVGRMLADGSGTAKNETLARSYFEKAASHGDNRASFNLAMMEDLCDIFACGAGGIGKLLPKTKGDRIRRYPGFKYPFEYLTHPEKCDDRLDQMRQYL